MITQNTFTFLDKLKSNNSKEWMDANRTEYEQMKTELVEFATFLVQEIAAFDPSIRKKLPEPKKCITRINRDMRFGKGKGPYKTDFYIVVGTEGIQGLAASYCVHVEPGNCFAGGGAPNPKGPDLLYYRKKISDGFSAFREVVEEPIFLETFPNGIQSQSGIVKKRLPLGFESNDPATEYLKREGFITREHIMDADLFSKTGLDKIINILRHSKPLVDFLNYG